MFKIKRAYEEAAKNDGIRILVDRLWPRGVSKEKADLALWLKDVAPSDALRKWFGHDPQKWHEFIKRYTQELKEKKELVGHDPAEWTIFEKKFLEPLKIQHKNLLHNLIELSKHHTITLVYAAHDEEHNEAVVLKEFLEHLKKE